MNDMHLALHGTAIKKHANAATIAGAVGLDPARADTLLKEAAAGARVVEAQGAYALTPAGRMILDNQYSRFYGELRDDRAFVGAYERFERVNVELKQVITDWQTLEVGGQKVRNDHSNRDYDAAVMAGGHCGFGLGATPNAVANMEALVERFGHAPRAFLVLPMVGAFFIDFTNAIIITTFINLVK